MAKLILNAGRRYEIPKVDDFNKTITCGSEIELKLGSEWIKGTVEHDGVDYYFFAKSCGKIYLNTTLDARG